MTVEPDRYRKLRVLGEGGGGRVWLVEDELNPGRQLALKELVESAATKEVSLRREFATLRTLRHPNLAEVFDFDVSAGRARFALEYVDGIDLVSAVRQEGPASLIPFAIEALRALAFLHDFEILHRDLKPTNLLVRTKPHLGTRVVLLDFGLAIARAELHNASVAGTVAYLAPELLEGSVPSRRSDLYGLGAVLYEAAYGAPPARESGDAARASGLDSVRPGLSSWIDALLALDPADRPATAQDALVRLARLGLDDLEIETASTKAARLASGDPPGRHRECEHIWSLLETADKPSVIFITGDVGVGKSRMLRWVGGRAVAAGWDVGIDVTQQLARPTASLRSIVERWRRRASDRPTVVLIDELEQATQTLADFVDEIARNPHAAPLRIVAAVRATEASNVAVTKLLGDVGIPTIRRVELVNLDRDGVSAVLNRATGSAPSEEQVDWLHESSGGNPLLLESLIVDGAWESGRTTVVHPTLEQSIARRIQGLEDGTLKWVRALCALGRGRKIESIRQIAGLDEAEATRASAVALALGLATHDGRFWAPASRVVSVVVREKTEPEIWRALNRSAAESFSAEELPGQLARLWDEAGEVEQSIECAVRAAEIDTQGGRPSDASDWYRWALTRVPASDERRLGLRDAQARSLADSQRNAEAIRALGLVLRRARAPGDRSVVLARRAYVLTRDGRSTSGLRNAEEAIALARGAKDAVAVAKALKAKAVALARLQRSVDALSTALESVDGFSKVNDQVEHASSLYFAGILASNLGRFAEATDYLNRVTELATSIDDTRLLSNAWLSLATVSTRQGRYEDSLRFVELGADIARKHDLTAQLHWVATCRTTPLTQLGHFDKALESAREAESLASHHGIRNGLATARLTQADILTLVGRSGQAVSVLTRALAERGEIEPKFIRYLKVTLAEALLEEPQPNHGRVRELLRDVLEDTLLDRKGLFGALVVEMERRVLAREPIGEINERLDAEIKTDRSLLEPSWEVRAVLARAQEALGTRALDRALDQAREGIAIAEAKGLPALAARLHAVVSEAEQRAGRMQPAREALDRARAQLEAAASRIADEQMRDDFLGRPVFRPIRRSALGRATAAEGRLLAIYEMVRVLNSETDPEALLETMLDMAIAVVRAERGLILLEGPDGEYAVRASRNVEPDAAADAVGFSKSVVLEAAAGTPVLAIDTGDDPRLRDLRSVSLYQIRSVLCVPLRSRGRRIGAVYLDNRTGGGTFGQDDLGFLEAFADHAALALENATARRALEEENRRLRAVTETRTRLGGLVGRSNIMQRAYGRIEKFASTSHPVLILGESGTGKELAARAIHALGVRGNKPFLVENCAAVSDSLLESELFGHVRGAFTGAERDRPGLFEQADGGTLFLDEIGDTTPAMQARLLRVLQEGEVRRVGDETRRRVDVRVLAATNKDLEREVAAGRFRDDLRHRLQVLVLELPPLRERPGDIAVLVDELLERIGRERGASAPRIRLDVVDRFERYPWPGNVRQLENGLKRLAVLAGDGPITLDVVRSDDGLARMLLGDESVPAALRLDHHEKGQIQRALDAAGGNRARAAKLLGISRATIFRKLKEHGLA